MVAFNTPDQDIQPVNTAFWARPIEQPKADISKGTLLKGLGNAFDSGIKFADDYVREGIVAPTAQTEAGKLHDQFVDALNTARLSVEGSQATGSPSSLTPKTADNLPTQVAQAGDRVDMIQKAMESGKLSETDYYGRVNALAKQLRSQFPGYKDEVDRQIARVTGVHSANAELRSQISDLNRMITQRGATKDRFQNQLEWAAKEGILTSQEVDLYTKQHDAGKFDENGILKIIADRANNKAAMEKAKFDWASAEHTNKEDNDFAKRNIHALGETMMNNALDNETVAQGKFAGQKMGDVLDAIATGKTEVSDEDWTYLAAQEKAQYLRFNQQLLKAATTPIRELGNKSYADMLKGADKGVNDLITDALKPWAERMEATGGKDFTMRHFQGELVKARREDVDSLMDKSDPNLNAMGASARWIKQNFGEQFLQAIYPSLQPDIDPKLQGLFKQDFLAGLAQPRKQAGGAPYEFIDQVRDAQNKGVGDKDFYSSLRKGSDLITTKDTPPAVRSNLIDYYFGPKSGALVTVATKGQTDVYSQLFTPLMSRTIAKYNPDKYEQYEQSAEGNAQSLFTGDINTLRNLTTGGPGAMQIEWHGDHFEARGVRPPGSGVEAISRINIMLKGLKSVYDNSPDPHKDVETTMFARLVEMGFDPVKNPIGVPEQIMTALMAARGASKATEKPAGASKSDHSGVEAN